MKKKTLALIVCLFLFLAFGIVYIFSELYNESELEPPKKDNTNAIKFKKEYEDLNGKVVNEKETRVLNISEENPFIYSNSTEIVKMIENKESFIVYFGFASCPWCRSVLETAIESAKKNKIEKIYYVDVQDIRDLYELDSKNKAVKTKEGTEDYYKLLDLLKSVLDDYTPLIYKKSGKEQKVIINEKRIYAPNFVMVKNGEAILKESGLTDRLSDPYEKLTDGIICEIREKLNCFFETFNKKESLTCSVEEQKC